MSAGTQTLLFYHVQKRCNSWNLQIYKAWEWYLWICCKSFSFKLKTFPSSLPVSRPVHWNCYPVFSLFEKLEVDYQTIIILLWLFKLTDGIRLQCLILFWADQHYFIWRYDWSCRFFHVTCISLIVKHFCRYLMVLQLREDLLKGRYKGWKAVIIIEGFHGERVYIAFWADFHFLRDWAFLADGLVLTC